MKKIRFDCYTNQWYIIPSIVIYKPVECLKVIIIQLAWLPFRIFIKFDRQ